MTLVDIPPASQCRILSAAPENSELCSRLYTLGMYPGVHISVLRYAPVGDPIQVQVGGTLMSIRRQEAAQVTVEVI